MYLDDLLLATKDMKEHLLIVSGNFRLTANYGFKFCLDKCAFTYFYQD